MKPTEKHFWKHAHEKVGRMEHGKLHATEDCHSTLTFHNANNAFIEIASLVGGRKEALRLDGRSFNVKVTAQEWHSGGEGLVTIRGGCDNVLVAGKIIKGGKAHDVEIDGYSDESHKASTNVVLNLTTADGSPVRYKSWMGCKPVIANPEQPYKCVFFLPHNLGAVWRELHRLLKFLKLSK